MRSLRKFNRLLSEYKKMMDGNSNRDEIKMNNHFLLTKTIHQKALSFKRSARTV